LRSDTSRQYDDARAHAPPRWRVETTRDIREIGRTRWQALAAGRGLYLGYEWMSTFADDAGIPALYVTVSDEVGRLRGIVPAYRVPAGSIDSFYDVPTRFRDQLGGASPRELILVGSRAAYRNELLVDRSLPPHLRRRVAAALVRAVHDHARDTGVSVTAAVYLTPAGRDELRGAGVDARPLLCGADTRLDVSWDRLDGYLGSLGGRRRQRARRETRSFSEAGFQVTTARLADCCEECAPLLDNVQRRYGHRSTVRKQLAYLERQASVLDRHSIVHLCRRSGSLAGFSLAYRWEGELFVRCFGLDYAAVRPSDGAYFNLVYYLPIARAIAEGLRAVHLGIESYEAKLLRGFRPIPLWAALWVDGRPVPSSDEARDWNEERFREWRESYAHLGGALEQDQADPGA
jgi:predicted N-acyltransferase